MIILRNRLTAFLLPARFPAMCIWPFILIRPSADISGMVILIRHERIHAMQQLEMVWIFFFLWYIIEFTMRLLLSRNFMKAYNKLSHEREAYLNDHDPEYLKSRKPYAWLHYL